MCHFLSCRSHCLSFPSPVIGGYVSSTSSWQRSALTGLNILIYMYSQCQLAYRLIQGGLMGVYEQAAYVVSCWHVYDTNLETPARGKWNMFWTTRGIPFGTAHTVWFLSLWLKENSPDLLATVLISEVMYVTSATFTRCIFLYFPVYPCLIQRQNPLTLYFHIHIWNFDLCSNKQQNWFFPSADCAIYSETFLENNAPIIVGWFPKLQGG